MGGGLEGGDVWGEDDECGVVGIGVDSGVASGSSDVVDVEEEKGGGECASLGDSVSDSAC